MKRKPGINFHCSIGINKLIKIINGNRKSAGFVYSHWVCLPQAFCITEVNLKRNEIDAKTTNEFSTEDLKDAFKITGYAIIRPDSWYNV